MKAAAISLLSLLIILSVTSCTKITTTFSRGMGIGFLAVLGIMVIGVGIYVKSGKQ